MFIRASTRILFKVFCDDLFSLLLGRHQPNMYALLFIACNSGPWSSGTRDKISSSFIAYLAWTRSWMSALRRFKVHYRRLVANWRWNVALFVALFLYFQFCLFFASRCSMFEDEKWNVKYIFGQNCNNSKTYSNGKIQC